MAYHVGQDFSGWHQRTVLMGRNAGIEYRMVKGDMGDE